MTKGLSFDDCNLCGTVASVDTAQIVIEVEKSDTLFGICVGNLIAIETVKKHEILITSVDKITRKYIDDSNDYDSDYDEIMVSSSDYIKVNIVGTYKSVFGTEKDIFKRGVDAFPQIDNKCYCINGNNLQYFMNLLSKGIIGKKRLKIGSFMMDVNADAVLDGNKFFQRHAAILGSTGSGKSWCVANILEKASELKYSNIIVFDMHGEYKSLTKGENRIADGYKIAGPGDLESESEKNLFLPYWILNREEMLSMILDRGDSNAPNQASRFTHHVQELKKQSVEEANPQDPYQTFTVDSPIPFDMGELIQRLETDNTTKGVSSSTGKAVKGDWEGQFNRFIARLDAKVQDKRYGFMFQPPADLQDYGWLSKLASLLLGCDAPLKGIKIIDFSEVPSDVLPVVTGTLARLLYDIQFWLDDEKRTPFTLVCDEAHLYLPLKDEADAVQKQALYNFERIAKEGRKYGVSILAVSQRPSDVSKTILSQCNNFIVLRLTNETDKSVIKNLLPDSLKSTIDALPLLDVGEALVVGDAILLPSKLILDKPSEDHRPISATRNFWDEWDTVTPDINALSRAVESLRRQSRL